MAVVMIVIPRQWEHTYNAKLWEFLSYESLITK